MRAVGSLPQHNTTEAVRPLPMLLHPPFSISCCYRGQDYRNELGFTDVIVSIVQIHYRAAQAAPGSTVLNSSKRTIPSRPVAKTSSSSSSTKGPRRVLRVAFFWDEDPFRMTPSEVNGVSEVASARPTVSSRSACDNKVGM